MTTKKVANKKTLVQAERAKRKDRYGITYETYLDISRNYFRDQWIEQARTEVNACHFHAIHSIFPDLRAFYLKRYFQAKSLLREHLTNKPVDRYVIPLP